MLIDWFTVGAQTLNFLILVWLMKRFLYQPILHAIDARETRIAAELADADAKKAEARQQRDEFQQKNATFDQQHAARLSEATDAVEAERKRLLAEARQAADALTTRRMETLRNEASSLEQALRRRTQDEVFVIAQKTLRDLATTSLEVSLAEVFIRQLRALDENAKTGLAEALKNITASAALVRSAFELPQAQRTAIQDAINETLSAQIPLRFETAPDLIAGIELSANGQKVAWSIAGYLDSLQQGVAALLTSQGEPGAADKPAAKSITATNAPSTTTTAIPTPTATPTPTASLTAISTATAKPQQSQ